MEQLDAIGEACAALSTLIDEFDRLGMTLTAALASQALDAAHKERERPFSIISAH